MLHEFLRVALISVGNFSEIAEICGAAWTASRALYANALRLHRFLKIKLCEYATRFTPLGHNARYGFDVLLILVQNRIQNDGETVGWPTLASDAFPTFILLSFYIRQSAYHFYR